MIKKENAIWGAIPDPEDSRDFIYEDFIAGKARPVGMPTLAQGYDAEDIFGKLRDEHQDSSYRCVAEGGTSDNEMSILAITKRMIQLSQRDAYSQIFQSGGGASPRDFYKLANGKGICEDRFCPSYPADGSEVTEAFSRQRGDITTKRTENAKQWRIGAYRSITSLNLEVIAQAIFENNGCGGAYRPINNSMGHMIWFKGYGIHKGYQGLKYRDSYPPYEKWIVKHKGKFYYSSTNQPLATEIQLYSIWTAEPGDWLKKKLMIQLKRATNEKKVFAIIGEKKYWINSWDNLEDFLKLFGYDNLEKAKNSVIEVSPEHLEQFDYAGNIGNPSIWDYIFGRK